MTLYLVTPKVKTNASNASRVYEFSQHYPTKENSLYKTGKSNDFFTLLPQRTFSFNTYLLRDKVQY